MAKVPLGENWAYYAKIISASIQKKERPQIETIIDHIVTDTVLHDWLTKIVTMLKENGEKPTWYGTSKYQVSTQKRSFVLH